MQRSFQGLLWSNSGSANTVCCCRRWWATKPEFHANWNFICYMDWRTRNTRKLHTTTFYLFVYRAVWISETNKHAKSYFQCERYVRVFFLFYIFFFWPCFQPLTHSLAQRIECGFNDFRFFFSDYMWELNVECWNATYCVGPTDSNNNNKSRKSNTIVYTTHWALT